MKVKVKNLGVLRQAEFSLGDLTIICGGNNTGKTYATYALYGFLNRWRSGIDLIDSVHIPGRVTSDLLRDGATRINLTGYVQQAEKILDDMCDWYTTVLPDVFAGPKKRFLDSRFHVFLDNAALFSSVRPVPFNSTVGAQRHRIFSISKTKDSMELEISLLVDKEEVDLPNLIIKKIIAQTISEIVFGQVFPDTFICSAERTGTTIFRRELNFARNRLLKEMIRSEGDITPLDLLSKSYQDYASPIEYNVDLMYRLERIARTTSFLAEEHSGILVQFADIIGGTYEITRNGELYFSPKGRRVKLSMDESSSSVRSMLHLSFYLHHMAERGDLLMIDEPELNLHPENQRRIARLFVRLVNLGIKVFVTTHSDYILKEINTLIMLNQDKPYMKKIAKREGYDNSELIDAEKIKVHIAEEALVQLDGNQRKSRCQTLVEAKIDPKLGIDAPSFDETINKMNEIQESLIWGDDD